MSGSVSYSLIPDDIEVADCYRDSESDIKAEPMSSNTSFEGSHRKPLFGVASLIAYTAIKIAPTI